MTDDNLDKSIEMSDHIKQTQIDLIRAQAKLDPGIEGDCELCGEWSGRLINGACAPCRDKYKLL